MNLLLDTHIWLWAVGDSRRLGRNTTRHLNSGANQVWLSPVSVWEFINLCRKGRFRGMRDPYPWIEDALDKWPVREAPFTFEIGLEAGRFELTHADPSDRLIIATARVLDCVLVTEDDKIIESGTVETIPND